MKNTKYTQNTHLFICLFISIFVFMACNDDTDFKNNPKKSSVNYLDKVIATYNNRADTLIYNFDVDRVSHLLEQESANRNNDNIVIETIKIDDPVPMDTSIYAYLYVSYFDIDSAYSVLFCTKLNKEVDRNGTNYYFSKEKVKLTCKSNGCEKPCNPEKTKKNEPKICYCPDDKSYDKCIGETETLPDKTIDHAISLLGFLVSIIIAVL